MSKLEWCREYQYLARCGLVQAARAHEMFADAKTPSEAFRASGRKAPETEETIRIKLEKVTGQRDALLEAFAPILSAYVSLHKAYWNQQRNPVEETGIVQDARAAIAKAKGDS